MKAISGPKRLIAAWNDFWFAPEDPLSLGVMRVLVGGMLLYTHFVWGLNLDGFFGAHGWQSTEAVREYFQDDWLPSLWWHVPADSLRLVHTLCFIPLVLFLLGIMTNVTSVMALAVMISNSNRAPLANYGMDQILSVLMLYLVIGGSGGAWSVDSLFRRWRWHRDSPGDLYPPETYLRPRTSRARLGRRLIEVHICVIYFFAGISKLQGESWWNGEALWRAFANQEYQSIDMTWLAHYPWAMNIATHLTTFWEISFAFCVWNRTLRPFVLAIGVLIHAGIGLCMGMITFGAIVIFGYLAFVPPRSMQRVFNHIGSLVTGRVIVDTEGARTLHPIFVDDSVVDDSAEEHRDFHQSLREPLSVSDDEQPSPATEIVANETAKIGETVVPDTAEITEADRDEPAERSETEPHSSDNSEFAVHSFNESVEAEDTDFTESDDTELTASEDTGFALPSISDTIERPETDDTQNTAASIGADAETTEEEPTALGTHSEFAEPVDADVATPGLAQIAGANDQMVPVSGDSEFPETTESELPESAGAEVPATDQSSSDDHKPAVAVCDPDRKYRSFANYLTKRKYPTYIGTSPASIWQIVETQSAAGVVFFIDRLRSREFDLLLRDLTLSPLNNLPVVLAVRRRSRVDRAFAMESPMLKAVKLPQNYRTIRETLLSIIESSPEVAESELSTGAAEDPIDSNGAWSEHDTSYTHISSSAEE